MQLTRELWGSHKGQDVFLFHLESENVKVDLTNFGATITSVIIPDRNSRPGNIVLGYNSLMGYVDDPYYTGCAIGRFAGRIAGARFEINNREYKLTANDGANQNHGGIEGFNKKVFELTRQTLNDREAVVELHYCSVHMEEGFPGNLDVWITYTLTAEGQFLIKYRATTDQPTHINLTNHSYFNLGDHQQDILAYQLTINSNRCLVNNEQHLPTGQIILVKDTAYDFQKEKAIGEDLSRLNGRGYNQCYALDHQGEVDATLYDPESGRELSINTNFPGVVLYTGDYLSAPFYKNAGVCLETQYYPDAPNHPEFPSTLLVPGQKWEHFTSFRFGVR